ncbi:uncharacterized protein LOC114130459 [Aphis gossypii]|uniref:uncharacterized protein LOC114130459 n=1 Tax=Aphis gossypii TaxID=80765 RepID=UPI002159B5C0|nr:uncharacterized protein LOC114130459 [Aphis gossypii]
MAYIQILVIVVCSCFLQEALLAQPKAPANGAQQYSGPDVRQSVPPSRPLRRATMVKRTVSRKPTAVAQEPLPPPPPKYPYLTAVKDKLWSTWEDINRDAIGKLSTRAIRNAVGHMLADDLFWSTATAFVRRRGKITNDSERADKKIQTCNAITSIFTSPNAMEGFKDVVNDAYGTVTRLQSDVGVEALNVATEMVNNGEVTNILDTITDAVTNVNLRPEMLIKGFAMLHKTLNMGGKINMSDNMARGLMSITSRFNK